MKTDAIINLEIAGEIKEIEVTVYSPYYPDLEDEVSEGVFILLLDKGGDTWSGEFGGTTENEILLRRSGVIGLNFKDLDKVIIPKIPIRTEKLC